jgi:hypothetical protein
MVKIRLALMPLGGPAAQRQVWGRSVLLKGGATKMNASIHFNQEALP